MTNAFINLSICYVINQIMQKLQSYFNVILYISFGLIVFTGTINNTVKLAYVANLVISSYNTKLFFDLRKGSQFSRTIKDKQNALICLEIFLMILNVVVFIVDVMEYSTIFSLKLSLFVLYVFKVYIVCGVVTLFKDSRDVEMEI